MGYSCVYSRYRKQASNSHFSRYPGKLITLFGKELYTADGLDKRRLASHIFGNPERLGQVNAIIHPEVNRHFLAWVERLNTPVCAIESAILFESGFNRIVDTTLMVYAPMEIRIGRILERDSVSREEIIRRIESQLPDEMKKEKSDYVIFNDGEQALLPQITAFLAGLKIKNIDFQFYNKHKNKNIQ